MIRVAEYQYCKGVKAGVVVTRRNPHSPNFNYERGAVTVRRVFRNTLRLTLGKATVLRGTNRIR